MSRVLKLTNITNKDTNKKKNSTAFGGMVIHRFAIRFARPSLRSSQNSFLSFSLLIKNRQITYYGTRTRRKPMKL